MSMPAVRVFSGSTLTICFSLAGRHYTFDGSRSVTRGQGGTIPQSPNHCRGQGMTASCTEKPQQCQKYFLQHSKVASERPQF